jgi:small subunit ribosomal protein S1
LSDDKIENPEELVKVGEEMEVKVLRVDTDERKIGLSKRRVDWSAEQEAAENKKNGDDGPVSASGGRSIADADLKGGLGGGGLLIETPAAAPAAEEKPAAEEAPAATETPAADAEPDEKVDQPEG